MHLVKVDTIFSKLSSTTEYKPLSYDDVSKRRTEKTHLLLDPMLQNALYHEMGS
jgi:hypothetical protein